MKILLADAVASQCAQTLEAAGHEVLDRPGLERAELESALADCDAMVVRSATKVDAAMMAAAPRLKLIGRAGSGVDNIDVAAATARGVIVMNAPGENTLSAAEHAWALMMAVARNIVPAHGTMDAGTWNKKGLMGVELHGKTLGVLGMGRIGREVATRAKAFGMRVMVYDPFLPPAAASGMGVDLVELEEIWPEADFLTVHTPLTDKTRHLIGAEAFASCKTGVRLVNCARGGLVDESALVQAMNSGKVAGAALDVFESEPLPADSPLRKQSGLVLTPHLGASTAEAQEKVALRIAEQFNDWFATGAVRNAVNMISLDPGVAAKLVPWQRLAGTMGLLQAELMDGRFTELTVTVGGEIGEFPLRAFTTAVLQGLLGQLLSEPVNLVNAETVAREYGYEVREVRAQEAGGYTDLLTVRLRTDQGEHLLEGTVFGQDHPKVVRVDRFYIETDARGEILFCENDDLPGRLAALTAVIAAHDVNIADYALGRDRDSGTALNAIHVDSPLPDEALAEVRGVEGVRWARVVRMPDRISDQ